MIIVLLHSMFDIDLNADIDLYEFIELSKEKDKNTNELKTKPYNNLSIQTDMMLIAEVFNQQYSKFADRGSNICGDNLIPLFDGY